MKQGKNPTRKQKILMSSRGLSTENWLVIKEDSYMIEILNKESRKLRRLYKLAH